MLLAGRLLSAESVDHKGEFEHGDSRPCGPSGNFREKPSSPWLTGDKLTPSLSQPRDPAVSVLGAAGLRRRLLGTFAWVGPERRSQGTGAAGRPLGHAGTLTA